MKRLALIKGAAQGLGPAIAKRLTVDGTDIVVSDVQYNGAQRPADELSATGFTASAIELDVGDERSVAAAYTDIERRFGISREAWGYLRNSVQPI